MNNEDFAHWVAHFIFFTGIKDDVFTELACRKLNKLGIVESRNDEWFYTTVNNKENNK